MHVSIETTVGDDRLVTISADVYDEGDVENLRAVDTNGSPIDLTDDEVAIAVLLLVPAAKQKAEYWRLISKFATRNPND